MSAQSNDVVSAPDFESIAGQIRTLRTDDLALPDVLNLAEIMVGSMRGFFTHLDTSIYKELTDITDFIATTKSEIGRLQPLNLKEKHLPEAGAELQAIVNSTEAATNTIMEQAEAIMAADSSDPEAYEHTVQGAVMEIFEACSFQDITGQRISKVVNTLMHIEEKISSLADTLGASIGEQPDQPETDEERRKRELILNGPALEGEGIDQTDVDELMNDASDQDAIDALFD